MSNYKKHLIFTLIVTQEFTSAVKCPTPFTCQSAPESPKKISVISKRAAPNEIQHDINVHTRALDASFNSITALKNNTLAKNYILAKVRSLNFSHNLIASIEVLAFNGLTHLSKLDLSNNKLTTLHPSTFSYARNLTWLSLSNNKMLKLPGNGHFIETPNLKTLELSSCNLAEISKDAFWCAPNLEYIRLDNNKFKTLDITIFTEILPPDRHLTKGCYASGRTLNKLAYVNISANPFKCDCQFYKMRKLLDKRNTKFELQCSCDNAKYDINNDCGDKEINQQNEITSVKSEETVSVVTTNGTENYSASSVFKLTSDPLPKTEEPRTPNISQVSRSTAKSELKTQNVSEISMNVAEDITKATAPDDLDFTTHSSLYVISGLLCGFIVLSVVLLVLFLRQRRKNKRDLLRTASRYRDTDCESDNLVGNDPSN
ncbi:slit homolog 1 protein-like [Zootermopsis nevadensis]|uniref:Leucine-rich repeat-containing protein 4B n=1 Tax=Zootermopsis nevadensis TaxID=136037 RepID=A0A067R4D0_ZOONE|nr:slit homolog 1 protein-like [Zootermopsis nevadensis]KDR17933.1 Leucine-rich repeat-containing protein 4B [Zootermopsis nevadensis]